MKYRNLIITMLMASAALLSCTKETPCTEGDNPEEGTVEVTFSVAEDTKGGAIDDSGVSRSEVYVFNHSSGAKQAWNYAAGSSVTVSVLPGTYYDFYMVCNKATDGSLSRASVQGLTSTLSENSAGSFVMGGSREAVRFLGAGTVSMTVTRSAAKITLGSITNALQETDLAGETFTVKRIYLINAVTGSAKVIGQTMSSLSWGNVCSNTGSAPAALLSETVNTAVAHGGTLAGPHVFYCYPNGTSAGFDKYGADKAVPMRTRLVVEAQIGSRTCYYPITIDGVAANTSYTIPSLTVTRFGADHPNSGVETNVASFKCFALPWIQRGQGSVEL